MSNDYANEGVWRNTVHPERRASPILTLTDVCCHQEDEFQHTPGYSYRVVHVVTPRGKGFAGVITASDGETYNTNVRHGTDIGTHNFIVSCAMQICDQLQQRQNELMALESDQANPRGLDVNAQGEETFEF